MDSELVVLIYLYSLKGGVNALAGINCNYDLANRSGETDCG